ncbi:hypothetical protein L198_05187 [Cryptococcus wingfieldii CBS 7118]|uniref:Uncharacterized protein n=1 Tax=Cryptococcus wingfieldii CBS 7118 TaxID=1295528 RepID=A0A1E3J0C7_9TREE|nr:hypothetical protein L198_05187 [Cryptococcus wingfieldii CBS 7118]ODN94330.1 hypothetical protein L198_05187 [Cryptococcus wingfieldii CBS 7118]
MNLEWKVLLEEASEGDDGATSQHDSASINEFNETKQHLLSSPSFASREGEIRNVLDVLSQGDQPSVKNFFTFCDGEYRIYGGRSGFGDGQLGDGDGDGEDVDDGPTPDGFGRAPMPRRLEAIRRDGVLSPRPQGTAPEGTMEGSSANDNIRMPMEGASTGLDVQSFFSKDYKHVKTRPASSRTSLWKIRSTRYRSSLGIDDDHAFQITKSYKASKGQPLNEQILGTQPEDGYVEALTAASQLVDAAPKTADGHCVFSFNTPSGYHGAVGKRHVFVGDADWLVSLGKEEY